MGSGNKEREITATGECLFFRKEAHALASYYNRCNGNNEFRLPIFTMLGEPNTQCLKTYERAD